MSGVPNAELDAVVDEVLPLCARDRDGGSLPFDEDALDTTTRFSVPALLRHLGLPERALPSRRFFINAGGAAPGKLEQRTSGTADSRFNLTLRSDLFISPPAVLATLAHELTHLYLVWNGHQALAASTSGRTPPNSEDLADAEEVRTEVACVALGFGALRLNGMVDLAERSPGVTLGYVESRELAAVIARVHAERGVHEDRTTQALSPAARELVRGA